MSIVENAMEIDSLSRREETRKRLFKWIFGVLLIMTLILCPVGLLILYLMGMDEMLSLFWAILMFVFEFFAVVFSIIMNRRRKKFQQADTGQYQEISVNVTDDEERTEEEYKEFWNKWDYFDNVKKQKEIESWKGTVPGELEGPPDKD